MSFPITPRDTVTPSSLGAAGSLASRFSLKGKTAIITGGGAGIGLAVAHGLAEFGANIALWYFRNAETPKRAEELSAAYGVSCIAVQVDIRDVKAVETAMDESVRTLGGRLDIVIANAGIPWTRGAILTAEEPIEHYHDVMKTNVDGVFFTAKAASKHWKRQKQEGTTLDGTKLDNFKLGSFVATASMSGLIVNVPQLQTVYNASKATVIHLCNSLAVEWAGYARANSVSPGYILTEISNFVPQDIHDVWKTKTPQG